VHSRFKLGLKSHDPKRVSAVKRFSADMLPVDSLISSTPWDWAFGRVWDGDVLKNDELGICFPAAVIKWLRLMARACGRMDLVFTEQDALELYTALGYRGTPETDTGVVMLDGMHYMQRVGVRGFKFDCFFRVGFGYPEHLATAVYVAPLIVGATLPVACQSTSTWDAYVAADKREWGGHAYLRVSNSPGGGSGNSWGQVVYDTPKFQQACWTEAYLPICRELMPGRDVERLITLAGQL
jgi:hypothetical protein